MFVSCTECNYDSGDRSSNTELAAKVNADGGRMVRTCDEHGAPTGWEIACPQGHEGDSIHLD